MDFAREVHNGDTGEDTDQQQQEQEAQDSGGSIADSVHFVSVIERPASPFANPPG
jgi:hypothetical protein